MVTVIVVAVLTGFGLLGISKARATIRLNGAAREYASYVEKIRTNSIRRHADDASEWASITINGDRKGYVVAFDENGDGVFETRSISLPDGVAFETQEVVAFDWRGRTQNTIDGVTSANAQVAITLRDGNDNTASVDITGSGDVTIDSRVFDDSVPNV